MISVVVDGSKRKHKRKRGRNNNTNKKIKPTIFQQILEQKANCKKKKKENKKKTLEKVRVFYCLRCFFHAFLFLYFLALKKRQKIFQQMLQQKTQSKNKTKKKTLQNVSEFFCLNFFFTHSCLLCLIASDRT